MAKMIGNVLKEIPWQECTKGYEDPVWRYESNPIITREAVAQSNSIFNSAVVPYKDGFAGVFRVDDNRRWQTLHRGFSKDAINWDIDPQRIKFECEESEISDFMFGYDPRVCLIDDRYYITWCNGYHGPTIGIAYTYDFETFHQIENAFLPFNRNGVLFPRKINGEYCMLSRPSDNGHTPFGDIFFSSSPDLTYWGKHRHVMSPAGSWDFVKVGPGPTPIETDEGWLIITHGVLGSCNGFVYNMGVIITDIDKPWKIKYRSGAYILNPRESYECIGDVPNVVFPCSALTDAETGRIAIYYGCADTSVGLAFTTVDRLVEFAKNNNIQG